MDYTLTAKLLLICVTNWVTVSRTSPVVTGEAVFYAVMRYDTLNQSGTRMSNLVARFEWKGKTNEVLLESTRAVSQEGTLTRSVGEPPLMDLRYFGR